MNGGMDKRGAFCAFYEEQVRYAFRLLADRKAEAFLFDGWDKDVETVFDVNQLLKQFSQAQKMMKQFTSMQGKGGKRKRMPQFPGAGSPFGM
jgi:hypothetical protein